MDNVSVNGVINIINSNKGMMTTQISARDIFNIYEVDKAVNRDISYNRLKPLSAYIDSFDSPIGIFLPALVFSFKGDLSELYDKDAKQLTIPNSIKLKVLDGQHRIKALEDLVSKTEDPYRKEILLNSTLTAQIYFNLVEQDERNLFADINSNAKRISMSLITKFDTRDIFRVLIRDIYHTSKPLQNAGVEFNKSRIVRPTSTLFFTAARLRAFIMKLLFGRITNLSKKNEKILEKNYDDILVFLEKFFNVFFDVLPKTPGDVKSHVLGHEGIQNSIALYLNELIFLESSGKDDIQWIDNWEDELEKFRFLNWKVTNPLWQPYLMDSRPGTVHEFKILIDNRPDNIIRILKEELLY
ncbi:DGQHR domain-containing protein [Priestia flexa]|uniref:DNA sulfur modification protein DndB n=1 Tax=Priestia flexa TaxID=86664 RepID=UPI00203E1BBE|nr:DNA sulfur modification protein DndB [Priestia flexa]MCM3068517.1 DGQHR domain-containing protein [Priestia flexa]